MMPQAKVINMWKLLAANLSRILLAAIVSKLGQAAFRSKLAKFSLFTH